MTKQSVPGTDDGAHPVVQSGALAAALPAPAVFYAAFFEEVAAHGLAGTAIQRLAAQYHWPVTGLRQDYPTLGHVVAGFTQHVTRRMRDDVRPDANATMRDAYFELFMARLDALQPHRDGFIRMWRELPQRPDLALILLRESRNVTEAMMEIAGWSGPDWQRPLHRAGLVALYARLLRMWARDDSADLSKTMSFLDAQLARMGDLPAPWRVAA